MTWSRRIGWILGVVTPVHVVETNAKQPQAAVVAPVDPFPRTVVVPLEKASEEVLRIPDYGEGLGAIMPPFLEYLDTHTAPICRTTVYALPTRISLSS